MDGLLPCHEPAEYVLPVTGGVWVMYGSWLYELYSTCGRLLKTQYLSMDGGCYYFVECDHVPPKNYPSTCSPSAQLWGGLELALGMADSMGEDRLDEMISEARPSVREKLKLIRSTLALLR